MNDRTVRCWIVNQSRRRKIVEQRFRSSDMQRVAVRKQKPLDLAHTCRVQVWPQDALIISRASKIKQTILSSRVEMNRGARTEIQNCDFGNAGLWQMQIATVIMDSRPVCE